MVLLDLHFQFRGIWALRIPTFFLSPFTHRPAHAFPDPVFPSAAESGAVLSFHRSCAVEGFHLHLRWSENSSRLISSLDMETDHSGSAIVNGETLRSFVGRRVRTVLKVQHAEGGVLIGQSTDGHQLTIKGASEGVESHYLEVVGIADNGQSITAEVCKDFGENFDAEPFNGLCKVWMDNKVKELFL